MADEIIDIVDENDNIVGENLKSECHAKGLWHRAASIFVFNKEHKLLVQKRAPDVPRPNLLCSSASGHLRKGDSYETGAKRELYEELGIEARLESVGKFMMDVKYPDGRIDREHYVLFVCEHSGEFKTQKEELSNIVFYSIDQIKQMIAEDKDQFTPGFRQEFQHYLDWKK